MKHRRTLPGGSPEVPNAIAAADARMSAAKHRFSLACLACLRGALDAPALVQAALQAIDEARAELRKAADGP